MINPCLQFWASVLDVDHFPANGLRWCKRSSAPSNWCAETGGSTCHRNHPWSGCSAIGNSMYIKQRCGAAKGINWKSLGVPCECMWTWEQLQLRSRISSSRNLPDCTSQWFSVGKHFGTAFYCTSSLRIPPLGEFGTSAQIRGANRMITLLK